MRRALVLVVVATLSLAGCFAPDAPAADVAATNGTLTIDEDRPEPSFNNIPAADLGFVAAPDANATLLEPPALVAGEWWRIELTDFITGDVTEFVRVVARVEGDSDACDASSPQADACGLYVFGMPHEGWWKEAVIFHTPAFGDVNRDLSHRAHDVPFQPLKFPLEDGATWETAWENPNPVTATVAVESPTVARVTFTGTNCGPFGLFGQCPTPSEGVVAELVYDATLHEVSEATFPSHTWRVLEHGYGFEGWVTVPRGEHLVFFHGRLGASVVDPFGGGVVGAPTESVTVEGGYNRVSFILGAGNALPPGQGGAYRETAIAPDGTEYTLESIPGGPFQVAFLEHTDPDGEWNLEHIVAGAGLVFIEGIAYHQYDIHLPSQNVRSDHSHDVVR